MLTKLFSRFHSKSKDWEGEQAWRVLLQNKMTEGRALAAKYNARNQQ
jgi:hypothetical protein